MKYSLHEIFSDKMNDYHRDTLTMALESAIKMRLFPPKFKPDSEDNGQYVSDPLQDFYGDCDDCVYFRCNDGGLSGGVGWCKFHDVAGWGFTCKHHEFTESALYEIQRLEDVLVKKDGESLENDSAEMEDDE